MRKVDRGAGAPGALSAKDRQGLTELDRVRKHRSTPSAGGFEFAAYKHADVKRRLDDLFHGKCAYCETFYAASAPVDVEHYRPKGAVSEDQTHPGYWWLAMAWDNLLPSCIDCNRRREQLAPDASTSLKQLAVDATGHNGFQRVLSGKKDSFPLASGGRRLLAESQSYAEEQALLLDPTRDDPMEHLRFHVQSPIGLVLPARSGGRPSQRGAMSIQIYGLNRLGLVQDRTRVLRHLEFLGDLAVDLSAMAQELDTPAARQALAQAGVLLVPERLALLLDRTLAEMKGMAEPKAPYSTMVQAWLAAFQDRLMQA
ncbi:hypothetical protein [Mitsuaria sp. GD03876]|uniref:hypothetical protein n=1 Tax=Mitsuaria sp. GD03876 TaxID=2975399 RepID=UPI00244ADA10|nr:hypothetical protein [Mitsuaria sp. GD03876]MDH0863142.1 hypothetical protein [Mitsuaria sp. GD03876]